MFDRDEIHNRVQSGTRPDENLPLNLQALWFDGIGDWEQAHDLCQRIPDPAGARIHAYLHRKEGDISNARYWYSRAGEEMPDVALEREWNDLLERYCTESSGTGQA